MERRRQAQGPEGPAQGQAEYLVRILGLRRGVPSSSTRPTYVDLVELLGFGQKITT
jgi:hypothetical protein